jgi:acyl carrier protein
MFVRRHERPRHMAFPTLEEVVDQLREIAEDDTIGPESVITSLEIDSLDLMEWVFEIEGRAETRIDDALYSKESLESTTVGDFYERVKNASS